MPALTAARASPAAAVPRDDDDLAGRALVVARRTALGVLGDREAAADVAQEVALQVVRRRRSLREPAALDAWVHRIAVRAALREAGRGRRRREAELARGAVNPVGPQPVDETLAVLDGLPPR